MRTDFPRQTSPIEFPAMSNEIILLIFEVLVVRFFVSWKSEDFEYLCFGSNRKFWFALGNSFVIAVIKYTEVIILEFKLVVFEPVNSMKLDYWLWVYEFGSGLFFVYALHLTSYVVMFWKVCLVSFYRFCCLFCYWCFVL